MADAPHDQNTVKGKLGVLFSDGETLVPIAVDPVNGGMRVNMVDTVDPSILALYAAGKPIPRDANHQPAWCAESDADPSVIFPVFVDADGAVLIEQ